MGSLSMQGESSLDKLLAGLNPVLDESVYVFATVPATSLPDFNLQNVKGIFMEDEGVTLILTQQAAQQTGLRTEGEYRCITCQIHSSLEAVGMTAAMSTALTAAGISANVVAAYFHDHIFVPASRADEAVTVLRTLRG